MRNLLSGLAALLVYFSGTAAAQNLPERVATAYQAYVAAMAAEDFEAAETAAREAWQAARRSRVDREIIGDLASNYGAVALQLLHYDNAEEGWEAAAELGERARIDPLELAWRWHNAALGAYANSYGSYRDARAFSRKATDALLQVREADLHTSPQVGEIYFWRAKLVASTGNYEASYSHARQAIEAFERAGREPDALYADAYSVRGLGALGRARWNDATFYFHMSRDINSTLDGRESRALRADALTSYAGVQASEPGDHGYDHLLDASALHARLFPEGEIAAADRPVPPGFVDAEPLVRVNPTYPPNMLQVGRVGRQGVVIVQFDVSETGHTENITILAEVPGRSFGAVVRQAIASWTYTPATIEGVAVRREGVVTHMIFAMRG
ncbi:MAG: energy transducer TonB [Maricaulis sp.]|jgi:TonB family protein|nr:energy transducer TonB [Maricaulis sp.]